MRRTLICAALLAAGIHHASAAQTTWTFTYQGFVNTTTGTFDAARTLTGTFSGDDTNSDGVIAQDELTRLVVEHMSILQPPESLELGCAGSGWSPYRRCVIDQFSYKLTGELDYRLRTWGNDEFYMSWYDNFYIGEYTEHGGTDLGGNNGWAVRYEWSDRTTFTISPAPVPEPAAALMLPVGIALLALARKRRRQPSR